MRRVHERSELCSSASIPSSSSTNAPKSVKFLTLPVTFVPMAYRSPTLSHGFGSSCRMPSESFWFAASTFKTTPPPPPPPPPAGAGGGGRAGPPPRRAGGGAPPPPPAGRGGGGGGGRRRW